MSEHRLEIAYAEAAEAQLAVVQNFHAHPGHYAEDRSGEADDQPSYRRGWHDAVFAILARIAGSTTSTSTAPVGEEKPCWACSGTGRLMQCNRQGAVDCPECLPAQDVGGMCAELEREASALSAKGTCSLWDIGKANGIRHALELLEPALSPRLVQPQAAVCVLCGAPNADPRPWDALEPVCPRDKLVSHYVAARAEGAAAPSPPVGQERGGWRPISEAPRDGSRVLAGSVHHGSVEVVCWQDGLPSGSLEAMANPDEPEEGWVNAGPIKDRFYANPNYFTHFRPLPHPPEGEAP
jgi:hypothetical protein